MVDLRTKVADSATSLTQPHIIKDNSVRLMVDDDDYEGVSAVIVVLDDAGKVLAKQPTTVGGDD